VPDPIDSRPTVPTRPNDPAAAPSVSIVMGSDSDWPTLRSASDILSELGVAHEVEVVSAHRTPEKMMRFGQQAAGRGIRVVIAGAGGAAHLPGMLASLTTLPVIGVPVATVSIGGAANAGLLAARILGVSDPALSARLADYATGLGELVEEKNAALRRSL